MISPIKTVVENCTERAVNYRFSCIQIFLGPAGTTGSKYVCSGDLFTRMENNVESELLVVDALNGRISISYECDDRFTVKEADRSPLVLSMSARNKIKGAQKVVPLAPAKPAQLIPDVQKKEAAIPTVQNESFSEVGTIPLQTRTRMRHRRNPSRRL